MGNIASTAGQIAGRLRLRLPGLPRLPPALRSQVLRRAGIAVVFASWAMWPWIVLEAWPWVVLQGFRLERYVLLLVVGFLLRWMRTKDALYGAYRRYRVMSRRAWRAMRG